MSKLSITKVQKRFLILWTAFHLFALITNLVPIEGKIVDKESGLINYAFTASKENEESDDFWPFTKFSTKGVSLKREGADITSHGYNVSNTTGKRMTSFFGMFYQYDISEFAVYILIGLGIVFIPKMWK